MAFSSIGVHQFITLQGTIGPPGETGETWERAGVHGFGGGKLGRRADEHVLYPVKDFTTAALRTAALIAIKEMQWSVQTVVDDVGHMADCLILEVRHIRSQNPVVAVGGVNGGRFMLQLMLRVRLKT